MHQKALTFGDIAAGEKILQEPNPSEQKRLGRKVKNFRYGVWMRRVRKVLRRGLKAKFGQNQECYRFLKETRGKSIIEAVDKIYGVGINLFDSSLWDSKNHRGNNLMGLCLETVRDGGMLPEISAGSKQVATRITFSPLTNMGSKKQNTTQLTFNIGDRKNAWINCFKGTSYIHFKDKVNSHKMITFTSGECLELFKKKNRIKEAFSQLDKKKKMMKKKKKKGRGVKFEDEDEEEEDDDDDDDEDDEGKARAKKRGAKPRDESSEEFSESSESDEEEELAEKRKKKKKGE